MGGKRPLDRAASEAAIDRVAASLELSRQEAAAGIYRMINLKMADGIRLMTLRRGVDPRKFALLSFGGAAGLHAAEVARELEIKRIIVPTVASVLSAWGMLTSDLRYEMSRTHYGAGARISAGEVRELFGQLEQAAAGRLRVMVQRTRVDRALGRDALRRTDLRDRRVARWSRLERGRSRRPDRGPVPSPARGTLHLCLAAARRWCSSTRASPRSARSRRRDQDTRPASSVRRLCAARQAAGVLRRLARSAGLRAR